MPDTIGSRFKHAWNAFFNRDPTEDYYNGSADLGASYSYRPDRPRLSGGKERSIINSIYTRIAIDVSAIDIKHVQLDSDGRYEQDVKSHLNERFSLSANIDQTGREFKMDLVMSMLDEGVVAVVPVDTTDDPTDIVWDPYGNENANTYDILSTRTGKIIQWRPRSVKIRVYNDRTGKHEDIDMPKESVFIVENPFYSVMNEHNSTAQRLTRKLNILDAIDEQSGSGKLDLIVQLPYTIKTELRKQQAKERKEEIERQLNGSKYGIAYIDSAEHITQLNRSIENHLLTQIEYLTNMLYGQLGITKDVMEGTANEKTMLNYYNRTIEPIISNICEEIERKFLPKEVRESGQSIMFFNDPFKLTTIDNIAEIADKFTRNEILSSNEVRQIIGRKPSKDPEADELRNKNLNKQKDDAINKNIKQERSENQNGIRQE